MTGWDEHGRWIWGKAGVRLTPEQADARQAIEHAHVVARAEQADARQAIEHAHVVARAEQDAADAWARGLLVPWRITTALDRHDLYGPEVDIACGTAEPAVDLWETGLLYPTWDQVLALSRLTGFPPGFFIHRPGDTGPIRISDTSLRFHTKGPHHDPPPVLAFTTEAVNATLHGGSCPVCGHGTEDPATGIPNPDDALARITTWYQNTTPTADSPASDTVPGAPGLSRSDIRTLINTAAQAGQRRPRPRKNTTSADQPTLF